MAEAQWIILHHYPTSPFAEKIRLILGSKNLHWREVLIPSIMPKPDVLALTGGYRKTPILQIGADVYCDSSLIADVLETLVPQPSLYPAGVEGASRTLAQWADSTLFWAAIPHALQPAGLAHVFTGATPEVIKAFADDRKRYRANMALMRGPEAEVSLLLYLERLEQMLGEQAFFFGAQSSIADFSIYHCLWFVLRAGPQAQILDGFPQLQSWIERMRAFDHGERERVDSGAAVAIAAAAEPAPSQGMGFAVHGIGAGEKVAIAATDTGVDPVVGELYAATRERISVARADPRAGSVVVHFPRLGFELRRV
jgi:glutathione S-transferase